MQIDGQILSFISGLCEPKTPGGLQSEHLVECWRFAQYPPPQLAACGGPLLQPPMLPGPNRWQLPPHFAPCPEFHLDAASTPPPRPAIAEPFASQVQPLLVGGWGYEPYNACIVPPCTLSRSLLLLRALLRTCHPCCGWERAH